MASQDLPQGPWLVVGLGNPGPKYAGHRHNVGAMVATELAREAGQKLSRAKGVAAWATQSRLGTLPGGQPGPAVVLAIPAEFMNNSGGPVRALANYHRIPPEQLIVLHDELDIDFGTLRLKRGGGEGGHNGLRSITQSLGTPNYLRIRLGIGRPPGRTDPAAFVLSNFSRAEQGELPFLLGEAVDAVHRLTQQGLTAAQQHFHGPR